jgi:hypothetical protein
MSTNIKEFRWALGVSILMVLLSSLPLLVGYLSETPQQHFAGTVVDVEDYSVHLAMMHYGQLGGWDYQFRFTTEPHTGAYVRTFYVVLGHLTAWTGLPVDFIFQIARVIFGLLACLAVYRLMTRIFPSVTQRRLALVLAVLGAGFGWFQAPLGLYPDPHISPVDMWLIDAYLYFSIAIFPHFSAVIAALAVALTAFFDYVQHPQRRDLILIALCALFVQIVNPIAFVLADCGMLGAFIFSCWQKRRLDWRLAFALGLIAAIQVPILLYSLILLVHDPAWAIYTRQNLTLSPPPLYYLFGFGLFWPFVIVGAINAFRKPELGTASALTWVVAAFTLSYLPMDIQRRFLLAITVPLTILAIPAILDLSSWLHERLPLSKLTGSMLVVTLASMSAFFFAGAFSANMASRPSYLFEPAALIQGTDWLEKNGRPNEVVLASAPTAQLIARHTTLRFYFGQEFETLHYADKALQVESFYRGLQPQSWLDGLPVTWVVFGPYEKKWAQSLPAWPELKVAYQNDQVTIYRVILP